MGSDVGGVGLLLVASLVFYFYRGCGVRVCKNLTCMWGWRLPIYLVRFKVSMWWTLERGLVNMTNSSSLLPLLTRLLMHAHSDFSQPLYTYVPRYTHLRRLSCMHAHTYIGRWIPPSSCRQPLAAHVTSNNDVYALHDTSARTHTHTHAHTHTHTHTQEHPHSNAPVHA